MKLKLAYYGNPILRQKCEPINEITDEIRALVASMLETMEIQNGIGLAAPQIHHALRLFVTCVPTPGEEKDSWIPGRPLVFINPKIISVSDDQDIREEGCLSIPGLFGDVIRPIEVTIEATDLEGNMFQETYQDLEARCILHENDHINGKLFIDRLDKQGRKKIDPLLNELKKKFA